VFFRGICAANNKEFNKFMRTVSTQDLSMADCEVQTVFFKKKIN
jgi:hypothetical protein